jgi:hypothetical protein
MGCSIEFKPLLVDWNFFLIRNCNHLSLLVSMFKTPCTMCIDILPNVTAIRIRLRICIPCCISEKVYFLFQSAIFCSHKFFKNYHTSLCEAASHMVLILSHKMVTSSHFCVFVTGLCREQVLLIPKSTPAYFDIPCTTDFLFCFSAYLTLMETCSCHHTHPALS